MSFDPNQYETLALRTESPPDNFFKHLFNDKQVLNQLYGVSSGNACPNVEAIQKIRLLHSVLGMVTEVGEIATQLKSHLFYGRPLDLVNLEEEYGDVEWYMPVGVNAIATLWIMRGESNKARSLVQVMEQNIAKLKARFPEAFSLHDANERDLNKEREVLES